MTITYEELSRHPIMRRPAILYAAFAEILPRQAEFPTASGGEALAAFIRELRDLADSWEAVDAHKNDNIYSSGLNAAIEAALSAAGETAGEAACEGNDSGYPDHLICKCGYRQDSYIHHEHKGIPRADHFIREAIGYHAFQPPQQADSKPRNACLDHGTERDPDCGRCWDAMAADEGRMVFGKTAADSKRAGEPVCDLAETRSFHGCVFYRATHDGVYEGLKICRTHDDNGRLGHWHEGGASCVVCQPAATAGVAAEEAEGDDMNPTILKFSVATKEREFMLFTRDGEHVGDLVLDEPAPRQIGKLRSVSIEPATESEPADDAR